MKLSTRIKKYAPVVDDQVIFPWQEEPYKIVLMVDCKRDPLLITTSLKWADRHHDALTKVYHCTLLNQESPVINQRGELIYHYTSTTYKEWCKA